MDIQFDNHAIIVTGAARWVRAHAGIWFATHADVARYFKQKS